MCVGKSRRVRAYTAGIQAGEISIGLATNIVDLVVYDPRATGGSLYGKLFGVNRPAARGEIIHIDIANRVVKKGVIIGAIVALIGMGIVLYYLNKTFPELELLQKPVLIGTLFVAVFFLGIVITWISTFIATQRFLNFKTDQLYY